MFPLIMAAAPVAQFPGRLAELPFEFLHGSPKVAATIDMRAHTMDAREDFVP